MRSCITCRNRLSKGARFCPTCGAPVRQRRGRIVCVMVMGLAAGIIAYAGRGRFPTGLSRPPRLLPTCPVPSPMPPSATADVPADSGIDSRSEKNAMECGDHPSPILAERRPAIPPAPASEGSETVRPPGTTPSRSPSSLLQPGSHVQVTLRTGVVLRGRLRRLTSEAIELEGDNLTVTLHRSQLHPASRARFFPIETDPVPPPSIATPHTAFGHPPAASPIPVPSESVRPDRAPHPVTSQPSTHPVPQQDAAQIFFDAFSR